MGGNSLRPYIFGGGKGKKEREKFVKKTALVWGERKGMGCGIPKGGGRRGMGGTFGTRGKHVYVEKRGGSPDSWGGKKKKKRRMASPCSEVAGRFP